MFPRSTCPEDLNDRACLEQARTQLQCSPFYATSLSSQSPNTTTLETQLSLYGCGKQHTRSGDKGFLHSEHVSVLPTIDR